MIALAGLVVGFTVGLTGMGGGALMTPIMVLLFKVDVLAAVSSDLVVSLVMKPVGGTVHLRRGTVRKDIALWLCIGSVPAAFAGVLLLRLLGPLLCGDVRLGLTASLIVGALPGVYAGARLSSRAPDKVVRPTLFAILVASGLKLVLV